MAEDEYATRRELRELREEVNALKIHERTTERRQRRLRGFVWGTDDGGARMDVEPLDARRLEEYERDFSLTPNQPSLADRFDRVEELARENKAFATKELDPTLQALRQMSKDNKSRSERNERELDKSLEKRARRFFGLKRKKKTREKLRF